MSPAKFSNELQRFIFEHVDSIGFLEALLLLRATPAKAWSAALLAQELRNSSASSEQYLRKLENLKLIRRTSPGGTQYIYDDSASGLAKLVEELAEGSRVQKHRIIELIYSPFKKVRDFSDAFLLSDTNKDNNDD